MFEARNKKKKKSKSVRSVEARLRVAALPRTQIKHNRGEKEEALFQAILRMTKHAPRARKQQIETDEGVYTACGISHVPKCSSAGNSFIQRGRRALLNATALLKRL